jgi:VanZ family protein
MESEKPPAKEKTFESRIEKLAAVVGDTSFGMLVTLAVALMLASMSAAGVITMMLARVLLAIAWLVLMITLALAPPARQMKLGSSGDRVGGSEGS